MASHSEKLRPVPGYTYNSLLDFAARCVDNVIHSLWTGGRALLKAEEIRKEIESLTQRNKAAPWKQTEFTLSPTSWEGVSEKFGIIIKSIEYVHILYYQSFAAVLMNVSIILCHLKKLQLRVTSHGAPSDLRASCGISNVTLHLPY